MSNVRDVGVSIKIERTSTVEELAVKEELIYANHLISEKVINVGTDFYNSEGDVIKSDVVSIIGEDYGLLLSGDKVLFGEDKSEGQFKEKHIWTIVDKIRNV